MNYITRRLLESRPVRYSICFLTICALFGLLFIPWSVMGLEQSSACADANTLVETINITGSPVVTTTTCDYGCDTNSHACSPHPIMQYAVFFGLVMGVIFLFKKLG
jgi:hypothetical protein